MQTTALKLTDDLDPPGFGKLSFKSSARERTRRLTASCRRRRAARAIRASTGVLLRYYNSGRPHRRLPAARPGAGGLDASRLDRLPKGYRYRGKDVGDTVIKSTTIKADSITVKGLSVYSLDEPAQGRVAVEISSGHATWCATRPAKASGNPPSTAKNDHPGKFTAQPKTPAPIACPGRPGSPSGAFVLDAAGMTAGDRADAVGVSPSAREPDELVEECTHRVAPRPPGDPPLARRDMRAGSAARRAAATTSPASAAIDASAVARSSGPNGSPNSFSQPRRQQPGGHHAEPLPRRSEPPRRRAQQERRASSRAVGETRMTSDASMPSQ